ncbi:uncharacterized protein [Musca autumnalis]|uniref:uncharacterized protein n=1 Tax=Musca autumnalis TaxID=221902 RepID=UPI003CF4C43F
MDKAVELCVFAHRDCSSVATECGVPLSELQMLVDKLRQSFQDHTDDKSISCNTLGDDGDEEETKSKKTNFGRGRYLL